MLNFLLNVRFGNAHLTIAKHKLIHILEKRMINPKIKL